MNIKKIKESLTLNNAKKVAKTAGKFVMENKLFCLQLAIMAGTVLLMQDASWANTDVYKDKVSAGDSTKIRSIEGPLNKMAEVMSGPVAKGIVTIGAAVGAASWAMNIENQVTKTAMRVVGGGSVAAGAGAFLADTTGFVLF
ncbi:MAG: TrbC/VirB2 family protein [Selenomonadaceae bacterium]|nr:TrbC/VirB2 family protein [Selenomonadaceae bacterium]